MALQVAFARVVGDPGDLLRDRMRRRLGWCHNRSHEHVGCLPSKALSWWCSLRHGELSVSMNVKSQDKDSGRSVQIHPRHDCVDHEINLVLSSDTQSTAAHVNWCLCALVVGFILKQTHVGALQQTLVASIIEQPLEYGQAS